jgi:hypothetical protein
MVRTVNALAFISMKICCPTVRRLRTTTRRVVSRRIIDPKHGPCCVVLEKLQRFPNYARVFAVDASQKVHERGGVALARRDDHLGCQPHRQRHDADEDEKKLGDGEGDHGATRP